MSYSESCKSTTDFSVNHDCPLTSTPIKNYPSDVGECESVHLQELLNSTCNFANNVHRRINETVEECLCENQAMGDISNQQCEDDAEKEQLFSEVTTRSMDYYRGLIQDKLYTRRDFLERAEQDMAASFDRLFVLARQFDDCGSSAVICKELHSLRLVVKALEVSAERYGVSNSESRFLCDLEKIVRCIEMMSTQQEKMACEMSKIKLLNHEICKSNFPPDDVYADPHGTMQQQSCQEQTISHAAPAVGGKFHNQNLTSMDRNEIHYQQDLTAKDGHEIHNQKSGERSKRRHKLARRICFDNSPEPEPEKPENYPSTSPTPPPQPPSTIGSLDECADGGRLEQTPFVQKREICDTSVAPRICSKASSEVSVTNESGLEQNNQRCPVEMKSANLCDEVFKPNVTRSCPPEQPGRRYSYGLGPTLLVIAMLLAIICRLWTWIHPLDEGIPLCTDCQPTCIDQTPSCFPFCNSLPFL